MKNITNLMINDFKIMKYKLDFMGYQVKRKESLSFHHLIVPKRLCQAKGLGEGYLYWNGAILVQKTSHDYLHIIEKTDRDIFEYITKEMIDINQSRSLQIENLKRIHSTLEQFEREHCSDRTKNGKILIKNDYIRRQKL